MKKKKKKQHFKSADVGKQCILSPITSFIDLSQKIAQSVQRLATGRTVRGLNPGGGEIFRTHPERPCGSPSLLYNGYWVFPGGKAARALD
jgi:hypothetical protein